MKINASIVLYNSKKELLRQSINSFLSSDIKADLKLFLIDHSLQDNSQSMKELLRDERIIYVSNPNNPGFGAGHNFALNQSMREKVDYHIVINPDISAKQEVVLPIIEYLERNIEVGMAMPKILNLDGTKQYLPKLLPSPLSIVIRRLPFFKRLKRVYLNRYELRDIPDDLVYSTPVLSGCFTVFRVAALYDVGTYDERFFMYFEDWDLSRRMHEQYLTIYFPDVSVYHEYDSGANHNSKLLKIFLQSYIKYFNKWGWFKDSNRRRINDKVFQQF